MIYRKPARYLSIKKRFLALTSQEKVSAKYYKRNAMIALILKGNNSNIGEQQRNELFELVFKISFIKYLSIMKEDGEAIPPTIRLNRTIDSFNRSQCWNFFEFRQEHLYRLMENLKFPLVFHLANRSKLSGEEVFLRGMYELVSGADQFSISENVFGGDQSLQSRAFSAFIDHIYIYSTFLDLLTDNLA